MSTMYHYLRHTKPESLSTDGFSENVADACLPKGNAMLLTIVCFCYTLILLARRFPFDWGQIDVLLVHAEIVLDNHSMTNTTHY
jgi:hypothetical protein